MLRRLGKVLGHDLPKKLTMDPERLLFKFFHFIVLISDNQKRKKKCLINCIKYKAEPIPLGSSDSLEKKTRSENLREQQLCKQNALSAA